MKKIIFWQKFNIVRKKRDKKDKIEISIKLDKKKPYKNKK